MKQISRDPFARVTYYRETVHHSGTYECVWCGGKGKTVKTGYSLYRYGNESDQLASKIEWEKQLFCSKSCHDTYHIC